MRHLTLVLTEIAVNQSVIEAQFLSGMRLSLCTNFTEICSNLFVITS